MKSLEELKKISNQDYEKKYKSLLTEGTHFSSLDTVKRNDRVREYLILRALHEENIKDNNLKYLYIQLNTAESSLSMVAEGIASIGDAKLRKNELNSLYIKDAVFESARDGYPHLSDVKAANYKERMSKGKPTIMAVQQKRLQKDGTERKPSRTITYSAVSKEELEPYQQTKEALSSEKAFCTGYNKLKTDLLKDVEIIIKDSEDRASRYQNSSNDPRSESYLTYAMAARKFKEAVTDKSANVSRIMSELSALREAANAYRKEHSGITKGMVGMGRTRYRTSERITSMIDKNLQSIKDSFFAAYGKNAENASLSIERYAQKRTTRSALENLNATYDQAVKQHVVGAYTLDCIDAGTQASDKTRTDALANALAINELAENAKNAIGRLQQHYTADAIKPYLNGHLFSNEEITKTANRIRQTDSFSTLCSIAGFSITTKAIYENMIRSGNVAQIARDHNNLINGRAIDGLQMSERSL